MRPSLAALVLALVLPAAAQADHHKVLEQTEYRTSGTTYTFAVVGAQDPDANFPRLKISERGAPDFSVSVTGGMMDLTEALSPDLARTNLLRSHYVFLSRDLTGSGGPPVAFAFGWAFASSPGAVLAMRLLRGAPPAVVFQSERFDVIGVAHGAIIGRESTAEIFGRCFETYDPFAVFRLADRGGRAAYSLDLSRRYNLQHYAGWAGRRPSEPYVVVRCNPAKPILMTRREAEKLYR